MATLVLGTLGTAIGGPIGGALGALLGRQLDNELLAPRREGPRLNDLAIQTSQYGNVIPKVFGTMRVAGTVIWATDLVETRETSGGKGRPKTTTYLYSANIAVALSSRPIKGIGRIWAEGNLLRGAQGDLKTSVTLRVHNGHGDQPVDPLIAQAEGLDNGIAHRGIAYAVLEDFDLADFGNRIPSLSFEVFGDDGEIGIDRIVQNVFPDAELGGGWEQPRLTGYAVAEADGTDMLERLGQIVPLSVTQSGSTVHIAKPSQGPSQGVVAGSIASDDLVRNGDGREATEVTRDWRGAIFGATELRYFDPERDFQTGLQRYAPNAGHGQTERIGFPAAIIANQAVRIAADIYRRANSSPARLTVDVAAIDPALLPGCLITLEDDTNLWQVRSWRWNGGAVSLSCSILGAQHHSDYATEAGRAVAALDRSFAPTQLAVLDLPSEPGQAAQSRRVFAALGGMGENWRGAQLFDISADGGLGQPIAFIDNPAHMGVLENSLSGVNIACFDTSSNIIVQFADPLANLSQHTDLNGNYLSGCHIVLGSEIIKFAQAEYLAPGRYRLSGLWRNLADGYGADAGHMSGSRLIIIDTSLTSVPLALLSSPLSGPGLSGAIAMAALGRGDAQPVEAHSDERARSVVPLPPVHLRAQYHNSHLEVRWTRRSRADIGWSDHIDVPLGEDLEQYQLKIEPFANSGADITIPAGQYETMVPKYSIPDNSVQAWRDMGADHVRIAVTQMGNRAISDPAEIIIMI